MSTKMASPPDTTPAGPAETFEIINERYSHQGLPQGVLATVPGRGRILRWTGGRGQHGEELFGYAAIPEDPARPPDILAWPRSEIDDFMVQLDQAQHLRGGRLSRYEKSAKDTEWEKFRAAWPFVAEDLLPRRRLPDRLFDPGTIHYHTGSDPEAGVDYEIYRDVRDKHVSGDWGRIGKHDPSLLDDPAAAWLAGLQDAAFRNAFAIRRGAGVVRSAHPIPGARNPEKVMSVATALIPGREAITLMLVRHKNQLL